MVEDKGIGERLSRSRRRSWWLAAAVYTASTLVGGLLAHKLLHSSEASSVALSPIVVTIWVAITILGFTLGCWLYLRAIDEVETRDNLVGAIAGLYAYTISLPAWWLLWKGGAASAPNPWAIYLGSLGVACAIFLFRRLQAQLGR